MIVRAEACDDGFVEIHEGCYLYNEDVFVQSYDSASQICQDRGGYLAVVKAGDENRGIVDVLLTPSGK